MAKQYKVQANFDEIIKGLDATTIAIMKTAMAEKQLISYTKTMNSEGDLQSLKLKLLAKDGDILAASIAKVLTETEAGVEIQTAYTQSVIGSTVAVKNQITTAEKLIQTQKEINRIKSDYRPSRARVGATGSDLEGAQISYAQQAGKLAEMGGSNGISLEQIRKMRGEISSGQTQVYTGELREVQAQLYRVMQAERELGIATRDAGQASQKAGALAVEALRKEEVELAKVQQARFKMQQQIEGQLQAIRKQVYADQAAEALRQGRPLTLNTPKGPMLLNTDAAKRATAEETASLKQLDVQTKETEKSGKMLGLTWGTVFKIGMIQVFHAGMTALLQSVRDGVQTTVQLEKSLSEIMTIDDSRMPFGTWAHGLRQLSDSFGLDILDQAEAAYQALSNQVVRGAEVFEFMQQANTLAVTTVSKTSEAVDVLSTVINAFGLHASQADEISASLFKTVELGRVRLKEMGNAMGALAVTADQLGLSYDELNASIATVTIQGIKFDRAQTLIQNIMLKLIRPTEEMTKLFRTWGVASGEAAIKAFGWEGVLERIRIASQGSSKELGELFGRIRAIQGAMTFSHQHLETYNKDLLAIRESEASYSAATGIVMENVGKKFEIAETKIKNFFTVDVGTRLLSQIGALTGDFDDLVIAAKSFFELIKVGAAVAVGMLTIKLSQLALASTLATKGFQAASIAFTASPYGLALVVITAVIYATERIITLEGEMQEKRQAAAQEELENFQKIESAQQKLADQRIESVTKMNTAILNSSGVASVKITARLNAEMDAFIKGNKDASETFKETIHSLDTAINAQLSLTKDAINRYTREAESASGDIGKMFDDVGKGIFSTSLKGMMPAGQLAALENKIKSVQALTRQAAGGDDLKSAEAFMAEARSLRHEATEIAAAQKSKGANYDLSIYAQKELDLVVAQAQIRRDMQDRAMAALNELHKKEMEQQAELRQASRLGGRLEKFNISDLLDKGTTASITEAMSSHETDLGQFTGLQHKLGLDLGASEEQIRWEKEKAILQKKLNSLELANLDMAQTQATEILNARIEAYNTSMTSVQAHFAGVTATFEKLKGGPGGETLDLSELATLNDLISKHRYADAIKQEDVASAALTQRQGQVLDDMDLMKGRRHTAWNADLKEEAEAITSMLGILLDKNGPSLRDATQIEKDQEAIKKIQEDSKRYLPLIAKFKEEQLIGEKSDLQILQERWDILKKTQELQQKLGSGLSDVPVILPPTVPTPVGSPEGDSGIGNSTINLNIGGEKVAVLNIKGIVAGIKKYERVTSFGSQVDVA